MTRGAGTGARRGEQLPRVGRYHARWHRALRLVAQRLVLRPVVSAVTTTTVEGIEGVQGLVGRHLGYSDWVEITQEQVNQFAEATGDHQWIHVDPERARKQSPYGGPIAHGYLTLSLIPSLLPQIVEIGGFRMGVNYGTEKVRFPSPVPVGSRLRAGVELLELTHTPAGTRVKVKVTVEREGGDKPACVAESLSLLVA